MKLLYLHGFAGRFDPAGEKTEALSRLGEVVGVDLDYTQGPEACIERAGGAVTVHHVDLIVGTSMGGWLAAAVGSLYGIPFVAFNPAIDPAESLLKYVGRERTLYGVTYTLTPEVVARYRPIDRQGCGQIYVARDDEVLDPLHTVETLATVYRVRMVASGGHRFSSAVAGLVDEIRENYEQACLVYGLDNDD